MFSKQLTIKGVNNGIDEISSAINFLANNVVVTDNLVAEVFDFDDSQKAFEFCSQKHDRSYGKVLIKSKQF